MNRKQLIEKMALEALNVRRLEMELPTVADFSGFAKEDIKTHLSDAASFLKTLDGLGFHLVRKDAVEIVEGEPLAGDLIRLQMRHNSGLGSCIDYIELEVSLDEQLEYLSNDYENHEILQREGKPALTKGMIL